MLTGQPASTFSIPIEPLNSSPPAIPIGVPSQLLERRPDIAAAERLVAQANAQIGIAQSGILSDGYVKRRGRTRKHFDRELVHLAEPLFLGGPGGGGNHF